MKCQEIQDKLLTDFVDNELTLSGNEKIQAHLAGCPSCREFLASVRKVNSGMPSVSDAGLPPERVWLNICRKIEERPLTLGERAIGWVEGFSMNFRPAYSYAGATFAALLVVLVVAVPLVSQREVSLAKVDHEMLLQLAYADDEAVFASAADEIGQGTLVEYFL